MTCCPSAPITTAPSAPSTSTAGSSASPAARARSLATTNWSSTTPKKTAWPPPGRSEYNPPPEPGLVRVPEPEPAPSSSAGSAGAAFASVSSKAAGSSSSALIPKPPLRARLPDTLPLSAPIRSLSMSMSRRAFNVSLASPYWPKPSGSTACPARSAKRTMWARLRMPKPTSPGLSMIGGASFPAAIGRSSSLRFSPSVRRFISTSTRSSATDALMPTVVSALSHSIRRRARRSRDST